MKIKVYERTDRGIALLGEVGSDHSIAMYWVIEYCDWVRSGALNYQNPETTSGVRTYSLRKR